MACRMAIGRHSSTRSSVVRIPKAARPLEEVDALLLLFLIACPFMLGSDHHRDAHFVATLAPPPAGDAAPPACF